MNTIKLKIKNINHFGGAKKEGQGGHGNMGFGMYNNKQVVYKFFTDGEDPEIKF
jgi:hypothetical protein